MNYPAQGDYIDIHTHGSEPLPGIFTVETLMAHENREPVDLKGITFTTGIHPWHLDEENKDLLLGRVRVLAASSHIAAIGEAGFDRIRGASAPLQKEIFEKQVIISEKNHKPLVIHCVRAWDELLSEHKRLRPKMPWLVHGFRGKPELALQLVAKGMYLSFWFEFVLRSESAALLKRVPPQRIFLETDGAGVDIRDIYKKVSADLKIAEEKLKTLIYSNFHEFFKLNLRTT
ncbi:MAG: TatD family hydrolase [Bacteroidales bacterium]|nr:TatD family hydrolase [Bacteroidales bacterium]MBN2632213.1 TatD family hydrolase [Bacteroidales bacterium]